MTTADLDAIDVLKAAWTDRLVRLRLPVPPPFARFAGVGGPGGDSQLQRPGSSRFRRRGVDRRARLRCGVLEDVTDEAERKRYDPAANSAQPRPGRQA